MSEVAESPAGEGRRLAVVTGSGSGLGRALCHALARQGGWHLVLCDSNPEENRRVQAEIIELGGSGQTEELDVASPKAWDELALRLRSRFRRLDLLVNNAGIAGSSEMGIAPLDTWRRVLEVNLWGAILGCHAFVPWLKENPGSGIINVASIASFIGWPGSGAYNVSKAALVSLSETLYAELRKHRVHVTVVCPGFFPSGLMRGEAFLSPAAREFGLEQTRRSSLSARAVADAALRAVADKRFYVLIPFFKARLLWFFKRLMPRMFLRAVEFLGRVELGRFDAGAP